MKLEVGEVFFEVLSGPSGPSLHIADESGLHRLAGPKSTGHTIYQFRANAAELRRVLDAYEKQEADSPQEASDG